MKKITFTILFTWLVASFAMAQPIMPSAHGLSTHQPASNVVIPQSQAFTLSNGFSWWSTYIDLSNNGLSMLQNALEGNASIIKNLSQFITYNATNANWIGDFDPLQNDKMYAINIISETAAFELTGSIVSLEETPVNYNNGWNWLGFPCPTATSLNQALANYEASNGDIFKSQGTFSTYSSAMHQWTGALTQLTPGNGYLLMSNSSGSFHYTAGAKEMIVEDTPSTIWHVNPNQFLLNMNMIARVQLKDDAVRSEDFELGAFCGDECRGTAILQHVDETDTYLAFLTIHGEGGEALQFRLLDRINGTVYTEENNSRIIYQDNAIIGSISEPKPLVFKNTLSNEETLAGLLEIYPNPIEHNDNLHIVLPENMSTSTSMRIQIVNLLGQTVREEWMTGNTNVISSNFTPGIYMVKVFANDALIHTQKLIVK